VREVRYCPMTTQVRQEWVSCRSDPAIFLRRTAL
jgi:hypothetical protein